MEGASGDQAPKIPIFGVQGDNILKRSVSCVDVFDTFEFPVDRTQNIIDDSDNGSVDEDDCSDEGDDIEVGGEKKKRKRIRPNQSNMTENQKTERRERNREHAKRSRVRKKYHLESLQTSVKAIEEENEKLKDAIRQHCDSEQVEKLLASCVVDELSVLASDPNVARSLDDPDFRLVKALQTAQQNFVITDPSLPDNPIVYASQGFLTLTAYDLDQVLGRNCRFLQGPRTDQKTVDKIRKGITDMEDTTCVLLNYRSDGSTFWNQFFIAALRDGEGKVVNYLGVQCRVSKDYARAFLQSEEADESKK